MDAPAGPLAGSSLSSALRDRKYLLVAAGFFACGLQLVFIGTHLAAYLLGCGLTARDGVLALSLIGLFNVAGTFLLGRLAARIDPSYLLAGVYAARTVFIVAFVLTPISVTTVMVFSSAMGLLWLGVGPVMTQLLAVRFGMRHLAALFGGCTSCTRSAASLALGSAVHLRANWGLSRRLGCCAPWSA